MALTVPEFYAVSEGASWREGRRRKMVAQAVVQLLGPHIKQTVSMQGMVERMLGGDPELLVTRNREERLRKMREMKAKN